MSEKNQYVATHYEFPERGLFVSFEEARELAEPNEDTRFSIGTGRGDEQLLSLGDFCAVLRLFENLGFISAAQNPATSKED